MLKSKMQATKIKLTHPALLLLRPFHKQVSAAQQQRHTAATVQSWISTVRSLSLSMYYPGIDVDARMAFRGDALEILTEYLMKVLPVGNKSGLLNYRTVPLSEDYGVDAVGVKNGTTVVVQCKYRSNRTDLVPYSDLARTFTQGVLSCGLDPKARKNLWLVTTADDANHISKKVLGRNLHVLAYGFLSKHLDGNANFWAGLDASI